MAHQSGSRTLPRASRRSLLLILPLALIALPPVAHAQGQFAGVRVAGLELVADRPAAAIDLRTPLDVAEARIVEVARAAPAAERITMQQATVAAARVPPVAASTPSGGARPASPKPPAPRPAAPAETTLYSAPGLFSSSSLCSPLSVPAVREALDRAMLAMVRDQVNRTLGGHYAHSNSNHQISRSCHAHAEYHGNRLTVRMSIPRNRIFVQVMTDSIFGSGLDPNFWTHYDLDVTATFLLPTTVNGRVVQETVSYRAHNVDRPDSRSITGKLLLVANDLSAFLGGPDFVSRMRQAQAGQVGSLVGLDLADLQRAMGRAPVANARIDISHRGDRLVLRATGQPPAPGPIVN